jgi:hypothetical protein
VLGAVVGRAAHFQSACARVQETHGLADLLHDMGGLGVGLESVDPVAEVLDRFTQHGKAGGRHSCRVFAVFTTALEKWVG